jgi:hypothetical protein
MHEAPRIQGAFSYTMILPNQMEAVSPAMRFSLTESPGLHRLNGLEREGNAIAVNTIPRA